MQSFDKNEQSILQTKARIWLDLKSLKDHEIENKMKIRRIEMTFTEWSELNGSSEN